MYGIYGNIYHQYTPNVSIFMCLVDTIEITHVNLGCHQSHGLPEKPLEILGWCSQLETSIFPVIFPWFCDIFPIRISVFGAPASWFSQGDTAFYTYDMLRLAQVDW